MMKIAIVGTGIAGMGCGHFLKDNAEIFFYEKNDYPGGHTNTITVDEDGKPVSILIPALWCLTMLPILTL